MAQFFTPFDAEALPRVADSFLQGQEMQRRNRLAALQEEAARMQVEEARTAAADRTRLRNRLSDLRGGYTYPEPGGVGPMPPGQESSLSQLMPVQQPASQSQIMDVYRQEAMQGNQFAAQSLPGMINLDNALAEYGARVKAGGGDINAYYEQQMEVEMAKRAADTIKPYLKDPEALKALWPRFQQMFPMLQNATPDQFVSDGGDGVIYAAKTPDGQLVPNVYVSYDENGKPSVHTVIDREGLADKKFEQQLELQRNQFGQQMRMLGARQAASGGISGGARQQHPSKPMPPAALKMQQAEIDAIQGAASMNANLDKYYNQLESGQLNLGPLKNWWNRGRNIVGRSNQESRNLQSFRATLEKMRNDSLRLNKGVQTEGDAQRAWNELVDNINDEEVVKQRLREIRELNDMAVSLRQENLARIRENYGQSELPLTPRERPASTGPASGPPASGRGIRPGDDFLRKKGLK